MSQAKTNSVDYKVIGPELLRSLRAINEQMYPCERCNETGTEPGTDHDACRICGGYGFNPGGDIREVILEARVVLAKTTPIPTGTSDVV